MELIENLKKSGYKIQMMIREWDGLGPLVNLLEVRKALRVYEHLVETRVFFEPSMSLIKEISRNRKKTHTYSH